MGMSLKHFVSVIPQEKGDVSSFRYEIDENGRSMQSILAKEILFRLRNSTVTYM